MTVDLRLAGAASRIGRLHSRGTPPFGWDISEPGWTSVEASPAPAKAA